MDHAPTEKLQMLIQKALEEGPFTLQQLAEDAGLSYDTLYSWARSRRTVRPEGLKQIAAGLRKRGEHLQELAAELEEAAASERSPG